MLVLAAAALGDNNVVNTSSDLYIAYSFAGKKGYSHFGRYSGYGNNDGPFIYTGFKPSMVITKRTDSTSEWVLKYGKSYDPIRNVNEKYLYTNSSQAETSGSVVAMDFLSTGFKWRGVDAGWNGAGFSYIYLAFAEFPTVSSNDVPTVAR